MDITTMGKYCGQVIGQPILDMLRTRTSKAELSLHGEENLALLSGNSFILASNHIKPEGKLVEILGVGPDFFILERILKERNNQVLTVLAKSDNRAWKGKASFPIKLQSDFVQGVVRGLGFIPVKRNEGSINYSLSEEIRGAITEQHPILIFPEGRWKTDFNPNDPLKKGAAYFAYKNNLPILPVYVTHCDRWRFDRAVSVNFGAALYPNSEIDEVTEQLRKNMAALQKTQRSFCSF